MLVFESTNARATVDPDSGGRLASLVIGGHGVLVGPEVDGMRWGCYPMVPFAGRIRHGEFVFAGRTHHLPVNLAPHAIHGYGYTSRWHVVDAVTIELAFDHPWPFAGHVRQRFDLHEDSFTVTMSATAGEPQPLMLGWHPWFRRDIGVGAPAELSFLPAQMYELDDEAIPTGKLVKPPPGPWDDCFTGLASDPTLRWGSALELSLSSTANHWVVYDEPDHAICVEPQSDAPDAINRNSPTVTAGQTLEIAFTIAWRT